SQRFVDGMQLAWGMGSDWRERYDEFDCSLGKGLAFLKERTGASAAVIACGGCAVPPEGNARRRTVTYFGPMPPPVGRAVLRIGVVDLATGDVLWANQALPDMEMFGPGPSDLREGKVAEFLVDR